MYLLILESIGTSELILIGIIALIFLGPRKLPQMARTIGKTLADLRNTTNEFKSTWEREVSFEEEEKAIRTALRDDEPVARVESIPDPSEGEVKLPEIRPIDSERMAAAIAVEENSEGSASSEPDPAPEDKQNWL